MKFKLFDLYSDYLLSSFSATTATGMSALMDKAISHDQVSRMLNRRRLEPADWWQMVKPSVRSMQGEDGVITIDDSIVEKPYTDEKTDLLALRPCARTTRQRHQLYHCFVHGGRGLVAGDLSVGVQDRIAH